MALKFDEHDARAGQYINITMHHDMYRFAVYKQNSTVLKKIS